MGRRRLVRVEDDLPSEVDWVADGAVAPVQNQVICRCIILSYVSYHVASYNIISYCYTL